jgi:PAS domain S-box-containing protein
MKEFPFYALATLKNAVMGTAGLTSITPANCKLLATLIKKQTKLAISETTLKRFYGFTATKVKPSYYTLDALAKFCGHGGWRDWQQSTSGSATTAGQIHCNDFNKLFYLSDQPMWIMDQDSLSFIEVNEAAVKSYGYTRERFLSMSVLDIRPKNGQASFLNILKNLQENDHFPIPLQHLTADGTALLVKVTSYRLSMPSHNARLVMPLKIA